MSASSFRALFDNANFKFWFDRSLSNKKHPYSSFVHQTRDSSKKFISNTKVDFILTKERLQALVGSNTASKIFKEVKENDLDYHELAIYRNIDGQEQLVFPELKFSTLNNEVEVLLNNIGKKSGLGNVGSKAVTKVSEQNLHKGHVFGFGNTLVNLTKEDIRAAKVTEDIEQLKALDEFIDALLGVLEEYDISTSDVKGLDLEINAKYRKTSSNWLIEWQGSAENTASGSKVNRVLGKTGASTYSGARGIFTAAAQKSAQKNMSEVISRFINNFIEESVAAPESSALSLLRQKSSPSMVELIADSISSIFNNGTNKFAKVYSGSIKLPPIPLVQPVLPKKTGLAQVASRLRNTKKKIALKLKSANVPIESTSNLLAILQAAIGQQVAKNMGTGSETRILNYRTGRFAESVSIPKISESRQGMISVFYSYMKNPYATFSEGGKQQYPKTRDPKLLISRSIRDIAAPIVGDRLRSVVV